ncbi:MAG TPA: hypothetical protein VFO62_10555 [Candidatus Binatia bacterium]|nr:hypothetical protein [Candidatus Binatia bacterium]
MRRHSDIRATFEAGASAAGAKPMPLTQSGRAYKLEPGDIQIARINDDTARTVDEALAIARKQDERAKYKATGGRFYVFSTEGKR